MSGINNPLRGRITDRWHALLAEVDGIPGERQEEPGAAGGWSVKDVLGHVAYWDADATTRVRALIAGQEARAVEESEGPNQREAARRSAWSLADVRAELDHSHSALLASRSTRRLSRARRRSITTITCRISSPSETGPPANRTPDRLILTLALN